MLPFLYIGPFHIPMYGLMIATGIVTANIIAYLIIKKTALDWLDLIVLEGYTLLGGIIGAKLLYIIVSYKQIDFSRMSDPQYLNAIISGGFVFYGGLILGLALFFLAGRVHKIACIKYAREFIFLIPWVHGFGRIGCFCAGCCYGRPYNGPFAVVFPKESLGAPAGVELFPIQIVEAICLLIISGIVLFSSRKEQFKWTIELYLILYGILRFILEYFRYDAERGTVGIFSTSQCISVALIAGSVMCILYRKRYRKNL